MFFLFILPWFYSVFRNRDDKSPAVKLLLDKRHRGNMDLVYDYVNQKVNLISGQAVQRYSQTSVNLILDRMTVCMISSLQWHQCDIEVHIYLSPCYRGHNQVNVNYRWRYLSKLIYDLKWIYHCLLQKNSLYANETSAIRKMLFIILSTNQTA